MMKHIIKNLLFTLVLATGIWSCEKVAPLVVYKSGESAVLQASATSIAPKVADSLSAAVTFTWTNPKYATDSNTVKYILQIDSSGRNFSKAASIVLTNQLTYTLTAKELNTILLGFGFKYNTAYKVDARIVSSYANNNDQLSSNVLTLTATPYVVPPKVVPPSSNKLFLVGDATAGGWNNPVPAATQSFTRIDSVTYEGTFYLIGGKQYLVLPVNGDWSSKFSVANNSKTGLSAGGDFGANLSDNFPAPAATGTYKIRLDFQSGKFTVTAVNVFDLLYLPGGYQNWTPASAPNLVSLDKNGDYSGYVYFNAATEFKITNQADWGGTNYGDGGAGILSASGGNMNISTPGFYLVKANTKDLTWSASIVTWGVVGAFTGWGGTPDAALTYDASANKWKGTLVLSAESELKFRANSSWDINLGDKGADGVLDAGGDNMKYAAGTYDVVLDLSHAGYYTYTFTKQ